eukprot:6496527-Lingulodinium_polyedra.AAC.1
MAQRLGHSGQGPRQLGGSTTSVLLRLLVSSTGRIGALLGVPRAGPRPHAGGCCMVPWPAL